MNEILGFSFDKSNLQHIEDSHRTEIKDFIMAANNLALDDKVIEDQFWAICAEGDDLKTKQAIDILKEGSRSHYYKMHIEEALQNDNRFAKLVRTKTA